jgi:hypothetical protein
LLAAIHLSAQRFRADPQACKTSRGHCCIRTSSGHSHLLLKITTVRFQKQMRLISLEIPEPDATGYQNLMRQNTKLTRSRATKYPHTDEASYFQKMIFGVPWIFISARLPRETVAVSRITLHDINIRCLLLYRLQEPWKNSPQCRSAAAVLYSHDREAIPPQEMVLQSRESIPSFSGLTRPVA